MATAVPGAPCMVIRVHPDVVIPKSYTFVSGIGSVTLTALIVAVSSTGGISCARSTPVGAGSAAALTQPVSLLPACIHPGFAASALYVSAAGELKAVGPVAIRHVGSLTTCAEVPLAYCTSSSSLSLGWAGCHGSPLDG